MYLAFSAVTEVPEDTDDVVLVSDTEEDAVSVDEAVVVVEEAVSEAVVEVVTAGTVSLLRTRRAFPPLPTDIISVSSVLKAPANTNSVPLKNFIIGILVPSANSSKPETTVPLVTFPKGSVYVYVPSSFNSTMPLNTASASIV